MKMLKKIAGVLAASALVLSMVACDLPYGSDDFSKNDKDCSKVLHKLKWTKLVFKL